jgi:hypothetical protein
MQDTQETEGARAAEEREENTIGHEGRTEKEKSFREKQKQNAYGARVVFLGCRFLVLSFFRRHRSEWLTKNREIGRKFTKQTTFSSSR